MQDLRRFRDIGLQIPRALNANSDLGRAGQSLLTVSGHYGSARPTAKHGITPPSPMFLNDTRAAAMIAAWHRSFGAGDDVDDARLGYCQQTG
jgi:hypothetical protein